MLTMALWNTPPCAHKLTDENIICLSCSWMTHKHIICFGADLYLFVGMCAQSWHMTWACARSMWYKGNHVHDCVAKHVRSNWWTYHMFAMLMNISYVARTKPACEHICGTNRIHKHHLWTCVRGLMWSRDAVRCCEMSWDVVRCHDDKWGGVVNMYRFPHPQNQHTSTIIYYCLH